MGYLILIMTSLEGINSLLEIQALHWIHCETSTGAERIYIFQ